MEIQGIKEFSVLTFSGKKNFICPDDVDFKEKEIRKLLVLFNESDKADTVYKVVDKYGKPIYKFHNLKEGSI